MKTLSSLENRVFLACAFVAVLSIAVGTHFVTVRVSSEAEADLQRGLEEAAELLSDHHASRTETLTRMAWLIADLPKLKAAVATGDAPTVLPVAAEYRERVGSDVMVIRDGEGRVLASLGADAAAAWDEGAPFQDTAAGLLQIVTVPIAIGVEPAEELGILSLGFFLDAELARELGELTQSEIVLRSGERVIATTATAVTEELVAAEDYVSAEVPLVEQSCCDALAFPGGTSFVSLHVPRRVAARGALRRPSCDRAQLRRGADGDAAASGHHRSDERDDVDR